MLHPYFAYYYTMLDIPTFLMRWLFLSNLLRDAAEVQTLPVHPYQPPPQIPIVNRQMAEEMYRDDCIRGILSNPPGARRVLVVDALRCNLVNILCQELQQADQIIDRITCHQAEVRHSLENDHSRDADTQIMKEFERKFANSEGNTDRTSSIDSDHETAIGDANDSTNTKPTEAEILSARRLLQDSRDFLPQLASAALKSPAAYDPYVSDPLLRLRRLLLRRCLRDPSWGIELCWLLEAEVGKAWKTLFEHRQQTGRRLIVVLPAEKAIVLAKIGAERGQAFDLLQEAEQATAYGYTSFYDPSSPASTTDPQSSVRLPSSIGLRRCSHFGDTMHFIDRLTKVSSDLRSVPPSEREVSMVSFVEQVYEICLTSCLLVISV